MSEIWKPIKGFPGYQVSNKGRVKSFRRYVEGQILSERFDSSGYSQVNLAPNWKSCKVHRLVLEAFVGSQPDGMEGIHLDDDPRNNDIENLCWGTRRDNELIKLELDNTLVVKHKDKVQEIKRLSEEEGLSGREIGRQLGVSQSHVARILRGEHWRGFKFH